MEVEESDMDLAKRVIDLEEQCEHLKEKIDSEGWKWRALELEKKKLEIDLKAARYGNEGTEKLRAEVELLNFLLKESEDRITTILAKNESLDRHYSSLEKDFQAELVREAKKQKVEEGDKIFKLCQMIQDLEREKEETESRFNVNKVVESETKKVKQAKMKISELAEKIEILQKENRELKNEVCLVEREKSDEINKILNENMAFKEEHKKKILELVSREGVLEREKRCLEAKSRDKDKKIAALVQEKERLAAKKKKMEMSRCAVKLEKAVDLQQPLHPPRKLAILAREERLEEQKEKMKVQELHQRVEVLEREKKDMENDFWKLKTEISREKEKDLNEKMAMDAKDKKISGLLQRIQVLEKERAEMKTEVWKLKTEISREKEKDLNEKKAMETKDKKISELLQRIEVLEKEKGEMKTEVWKLKTEMSREKEKVLNEKVAMEAKGKKILDLVQRLEVLAKEKGEMEDEVCKLKREISNEKWKALNEKKAMEAKEEKISELVQRIEVLQKENREMEAKHVMREESEINRILKEKMTVKSEGEKKIKELEHRIDILEREKGKIEEENMQRIDAIEVLGQEKECLNDKIKNLKMEINKLAVHVKLEDNAELPQSNVCILGSFAQNQGKQSVNFLHSDEHPRSLNYGATVNIEDDTKTGANGNIRKRPSPKNLSANSFTAKCTRPGI